MIVRKPTVGRIVHYISRGSADGVYPSTSRAAIVTDAVGMKVKLTVFNPEGTYYPPQWVKMGQAPGQWNWPEIS